MAYWNAFRNGLAVGTLAAFAAMLPSPVRAQNTSSGQSTGQSSTQTSSQTPAQSSGPVVTSDVGAISMPVTVVDDKGNPVKNLAAADLKLVDNGSEQKIQSFAAATPTPAVFALVGQTTPGLRGELGDMRLGSVHFVDHVLPGTTDQVFVIQYATEVDLLADPTATVTTLHDAVNKFGSPQYGADNGDTSGGSSSEASSDSASTGSSGGTLYDAIYLAANEELKKLPGQHVLVLISDGIDRGSKESQSDAVAAAQDAHTAIFAIYYPSQEEPQHNPNQGSGGHRTSIGGMPGGGSEYPGAGRRGEQAPSSQAREDGKVNLEHMCSATGGYMIEGKRDKSDDAYNKLIALLHNQYTLTFVPTKDAADSQFQRISLTTLKKGVYPLVQEGYTPQQ